MATSSNIGRILEGKYEIVRLLGEGGMGEVYEARHQLIDRQLAIKLLRSEYATNEEIVERFTREARASAAIGHDHIVEITDMGVVDSGELFIVMEYLEGQDLEALLSAEGRLTPKRACHIMIQVLSALEAAHSEGVVHRDLEPANIFLPADAGAVDCAKLVDFGISKMQTNENEGDKGLTRTGIIMGTPTYMSPEQAAAADITHGTDIFAAGVILYEMVTGKLPFDGTSMVLVLAQILKEDPTDAKELCPELPDDLCATIRRAMMKEPGDRFPDVAAFRRDISHFSPETDELTGLATTRLSGRAVQLKDNLANRNQTNGASLRKNDSGFMTTPLGVSMTGASPAPGAKKKLLATLGAVAVLLGVAGFVLFKMLGGPDTLEEKPVDAAAPAVVENTDTSPKEVVTLKIDVKPTEAEILVDGDVVGKGGFEGTFEPQETPRDITIRAEGYSEDQQKVVLDRSISIVVNLEKRSEEVESAEPPKPPPGKGGNKGGPKPGNQNKPGQNSDNRREIDEDAPW